MRSVTAKLVLLLPLVALLGGAAPAERPGELPAEDLVFSAIDGSSWDADGMADGVWTWSETLRLEQRLTCGDAAGCSVALAVAGDLEIAPGAGIESAAALRLAVDGELRLAAGSYLAAERGAVQISAARQIVIDGLVSASAGAGRGAGRRATISITATGGPGNGIRLGDAATLISEGGALGSNGIELAGCGIEVMGLVATVASGPGAAVSMRSCEGLRIDGGDLDLAVAKVGGKRRGRVEVRGGGGSSRISLWAAEHVVLDGTDLRVGRGPESRIDVTAEAGGLSWRRGRGRVSRAAEAAAEPGDEPLSRIRLSACTGFDLTGAEFDPRAELEMIDACGPEDEEERRQRESTGVALEAPTSADRPGTRAAPCTPDVMLSSQTVSTIEEYVACNSITAEDFHIIPRGYVTFRAGQLIVLDNGFSVEGSAQFFAVLDPTLNQPPVAQDDAFTVNEDSGALNGNVLADNGSGVDSDPDGDPLTVNTVPVSGPTDGILTLMANGDFTYTPDANFNAVDMFEYEISDGSGGTDVGKVTITVDGVNDAPSFTKGADEVVLEDAGVQTVAGWATAISPGPANEAGQMVSFNVSNDNNALFATQPAVDGTGQLTYTPAMDANGVANVTVEAMDDGGTANGGVDTSAPQLFTITVTPVNDAPSFTKGADEVVLEDAGAQTVAGWATAISPGPADEAGQTVSFNVSNDNNALFSTQPAVDGTGQLTYTPAADANGVANVTVEAMDDGGTANGGADTSAPQLFTITVTPVNDVPSFTKGADETVLEDAGVQTVAGWATAILPGPANEAGQTVSFNLTNDNNALFATQPAVDGTGQLTYTPAMDANGVANVTVEAMDDGGTANGGVDTSAPQMFTITVTPVNDPPVITSNGGGAAVMVSVPENQTAVTNVQTFDREGDTESGGGLTYSLTGGADLASFSIDAGSGVLTFTAAPDFESPQDLLGTTAAGDNVYEVRVTVTDGGGQTDVQDLQVTVTDVLEPTAGQPFNAGLGSFANTKSLTLEFQAMVDAAFPKALTQLFNQAQVTADGPIDVLSAPVTTPVDRAPQVAAVFVNDSSWTAAFRTELATRGVGDATLGYALPGGPVNAEGKTQLDILPWTGLDEISLRFTEDVDVELVDLQLQSITPITVNTFSYNAGTFTATWTLTAALGSNKVRTVADGTSGVRDAAGNQLLDGEWLDDVAAFSSGDGAAGGDFSFRFNVQPADVNGDGLGTPADTAAVQALNGTSIGPGYEIFLDLNGDGTIDGADQALATAEEGSSQPAGEPAGTAASGWVPDATPPAPPGAGTPAPPITVTKTDSLVVDVDGDGQADPGDTLRYDVTITNVSGGTATSLAFSDAGAFPNATLGKRGPAALPDSYMPLGVLVEPAATGLLANDFDIDGVTPQAGLTVVSTMPVGALGTLVAALDGSFTYTPPGMGSGVDTFNYTVLDGDLLVGIGQVMFVLNTPPMIGTDPIAYTTAGNTQLKGGSGAMSTAVAYVEDADNIPTKAVVTDNETPGSLVFSLDSGPSNGSATVSAAGNFLYTPNPGFVGADSFDYAVSDGIDMVTGTVNVTVTDTNGVTTGNQVIWYVENDAAMGGNGTSSSPFDTLKSAESMNLGAGASDDGDTIFVLEGDGMTTNQDAGLRLDGDQKLLGHAATTLVANGITIQTPSPGAKPKIENTAGDGVEVTDQSGVEIRNLDITGSVIGIDIDASSAGAKTVTVTDNFIAAAGNAFDVLNSGAGDLELVFANNTKITSAAGAGAAVRIEDSAAGSGALFVTSFSTNEVLGSSAGEGVRVLGVVFDSDPSDADFDLVAGGNLTVGLVSDRVDGAGVVLGVPGSRVKGNLAFGTVNIFSSGGAALSASGDAVSAGGSPPTAGFLLAITGGTADAAGGPAVVLGPLTANIQLTTVSSSASPTFGVSLDSVDGTFNAMGGSITTASSVGFRINSGTVAATYSGGIAQSTNAPAVAVSGGHNSGTVTFDTGTISATAGTGLLFDNADATYSFNGLTTLSGGDAGIDILNGSAGGFTFADTSITSPSGIAFNVADSTAAVTYSGGTLTQASNAAAVNVLNHSTSTIGFGGTVNATGGAGLQFSNADGTYNVNLMTGSTTLNGGDAGIDILNGSTGTFTFGSSTSITDPTGIGLQIDASAAGNVDYNGTISQSNAASAVRINAKTGGSVTFSNSITANTSTATGIDLTSNSGGTFTFSGLLDIDTTTGTGFNATGAGTIQVTNAGNTVNTVGDGVGNGIGVNIGATIGGLGVGFSSVNVGSSGKAASGILLSNTGTAGTFSVTGGTIQNTTGASFAAIDVDGPVNVGASLQNDGGRSVDIITGSAGTFTFTGGIDEDAQGINISSNGAGGTFTFQGGIDVDTIGSNTGLRAFSGGTLNICADTNCSAAGGTAVTNTIDVGTATALSVDSVTIGTEGVTFRSISANGGANGIVLDTTGTGSFEVTGDGSTATQGGNDTGGVIQSTTGDGILLEAAQGVTLRNMTIGDTTATPANSPDGANNIIGDGIQATGVIGLSLFNVTIARTGGHGVNAVSVGGAPSITNLIVDDSLILNAGDGQEEHGLNLDELRGDNFVSDSLFDAFNETGLELINTSGTVDLTVDDTTFQDNQATVGNAGEEAILIEAQGTAAIVALVTGDATTTASIFDDIARQAIQAISLGSTSDIQLTVENSNFVETQAGDAVVIMNPDFSGSGNITVRDNTFDDDALGPFAVLVKNDSSGTLDATIQGNTVTDMQLLNVNHDDVGSGGAANGTSKVLVGGTTAGQANNVTVNSNNIAVDVIATETGPSGSGPDLSFTAHNNVTSQPDGIFSFSPGLRIDVQGATRANVNLTGNSFQGDPTFAGGSGIELKEQGASVVGIQGFGGGAPGTCATAGPDPVSLFVDGLNPLSLAASFVCSNVDNNIGSGTASLPTTTTLPSP